MMTINAIFSSDLRSIARHAFKYNFRNALLYVLLFFALHAGAQDFNLLETDASGDGSPDISMLSYAIDETQDSLWFKIELHSDIWMDGQGDFAYYVPIDTDGNPNNGTNIQQLFDWPGFPGGFDNMNSDLVVYFGKEWGPAQHAYVGTWNGEGWDNMTGHWNGFDSIAPVSFQMLDLRTFVLGVRWSNVDQQQDGTFDLVALSGFVNNPPNDIVPENGFVTTSPLLTTIWKDATSGLVVSAFPNPVNGSTMQVSVDSDHIINEPFTFSLYNMNGSLVKKVSSLSATTIPFDLSDVSNGIYMLEVDARQVGSVREKVIISR